MTQSTQVAVIPQHIELPAHLKTAEAAAAIAKYNTEAAGGIKTGGFPRISIKGGKFHIVDEGKTQTIFAPPPSPPGLPQMQLETVIVAANAAIVKTYYPGDYKEGDDSEPACSSDNGVTPDAHIASPQAPACATCPQNQWGSKISKSSGKEVKACSDSKRLAVLPIQDLTYKVLGLGITPSALTDWGRYVKALTERNIPVNAVVTNLTFDHTAAYPKLKFAFGRVLTAEEYAKVQARSRGDDVKDIVNPSPRQATAPAQPAAPAPTGPVHGAPAATAPAPATPAAAAPITGFGATPQPEAEAVKRTRAPRAKAPEAAQQAAQTAAAAVAAAVSGVAASVAQAVQQTIATDPLAHLPPEIRATVTMVGADTEIGRALIAKYPRPEVAAPAAPAPQAAAPTGFGATTTTAPAPTPQVATTAAALGLKEQLKARLQAGQAAAGAAGK